MEDNVQEYLFAIGEVGLVEDGRCPDECVEGVHVVYGVQFGGLVDDSKFDLRREAL